MTDTHCTGTALVYSGRADPKWAVDEEQLETLKRIWKRLPASRTAPPTPPPLGYRGCALRCTSGQCWFAYNGTVTFKRGSSRPQHKVDSTRRFERVLLETAPPDALPSVFRIPR
jgi:hypothetical protein